VEGGGELDVSVEDLHPDERTAFERAVASGALAHLVKPWAPWWNSQAAAHLSLSAAGTHIIHTVDPQGMCNPVEPLPARPAMM
jgi:hypothetical protein